MNKERRKQLNSLADELRTALGTIEDIKSQIETERDGEQEYFDNMPESFQSGDKGQAAEAAVEAMDEALGQMDDVVSYLSDAAAALENAAE